MWFSYEKRVVQESIVLVGGSLVSFLVGEVLVVGQMGSIVVVSVLKFVLSFGRVRVCVGSRFWWIWCNKSTF